MKEEEEKNLTDHRRNQWIKKILQMFLCLQHRIIKKTIYNVRAFDKPMNDLEFFFSFFKIGGF